MASKKSSSSKSTAAKSQRAPQSEAKAKVKKASQPATVTKKETARRRSAQPADAEKRAGDQQAGNESFPVVGIGASAGGLEAFRQLLDHLSVDTGMAFVLVQHLDPTHESILTELLSRSTRMPVSEVADGMKVEPDHVYVIPPNTNMAMAEGVLRLLPREEARGQHRPIDYFLRTLSEDQRHRAIGVILSGTASDGTLGLEAIKAEGGITFAQEATSAKYDSMPRSAIAAGHVDFILTPEGIAQELARISRHPYVTPAAKSGEKETPTAGRNGYGKILALLRKSSGVDFTDYKANTLHRRSTRRMVLNKLESRGDYAQHLRENAAEVKALYQDILINVTSFFRDRETFAFLKERIFPQLIQHRAPDEPLRFWTLGCSTGEEAYSIAISFAEFAGEEAEHIPVQIFATDLSEKGIEKARPGLYPKDIAEDVSPERLRRFFTEANGGYRVSKPIRDMVVFARQNVIADPPFSRLDLISCRNLLIYLEPVLQKQVLPTLHYALKPSGILWLGSSETVGSSSELFAPEDKKHKFYSKKPASSRMHFHSARATGAAAAGHSAGSGQKTNYVSEQLRGEHDAQKEADRILLARYSPAGVLVNAEMEILQFRGSTGAYLEPPAGKATLNLLKMAREGLMLPLRAAIQKVKKDDATVRKEGARVADDGETRQINLEVIPVKGFAANERCFLILFEPAGEDRRQEQEEGAGGRRQEEEGGRKEGEDHRVTRLQEELAATREYTQSLVEQHEAANEELQSANEEIQSSNEELQSVNEELETAKEELESSNEELTTLNDELQNRNQELTILNDDQSNLFVSVSLPIVMLGNDLRIRHFTPQAEKVLSLIATGVGRPVGDIKPNINVPDLEELIAEVIQTVSVKEREVQDKHGRWYSMRVRPYKTLDNRIDGAVVVLIDIDALKRSETEIRESRDYAEAIIETVREPLIVLDENLRVRTANRCFYENFQATPEETENRLLFELGNRQWDIPKLRTLLEEILPQSSQLQDFEVEQEFARIGTRTMLLNARRLAQESRRAPLILLAIEDITERRQAGRELTTSEIRYRRLFEAANDGILILDPASRQIIDANPFMTELLGYPREEFLGKELWQIGLLKDEEASRAAFQELKEKGVIRYEDLPLETTTGERREVEFVSNIYQEDGHEVVQCNIRDITERKQLEDALRESEERYCTLFGSVPIAVFVCDRNAVIQHYNRRAVELWGREPTCGVEKHCGSAKLYLPDGALLPHAESPMVGVLRTGIPANNVEVFIERPDGSRIAVIVNFAALKNARGEITGAVTSFMDITERKRAEEERNQLLISEQSARAEADEANRMKDEFLATVSHELRTPLTAIMGWANMLQGGALDEKTAARAIETIARNARAQNQIIDDLLDVSRIISGKLRFEAGAVEMVPVIEAALDVVRPAAEAKGIELRTTLNPTAGLVSGDAGRLQQIVWNLLANAIKYTPKGGRVEARLEREDTHVAIVVHDTGEGLSPEILPYIFDRFRQSDGATTRRHGGLGLGLAIVRHLVEAHGGTVRAASHGEGHGATFTVTLPLLPVRDEGGGMRDESEGVFIHPSSLHPHPLLKGLRVLAVDDNKDARELLTLALTHSGAEVRAAASVAAALDTLDQWQPDVLVSDIGMPGEDGYALIRKVRARAPQRGGLIPALALTGYASAEDAARALAAGFQTYMPKPINLAELVAGVANLAKRAEEV